MGWRARKLQDREGNEFYAMDGPVGDTASAYLTADIPNLQGGGWSGHVRHPKTNTLVAVWDFSDGTTAESVSVIAEIDTTALVPGVTYVFDIKYTKNSKPRTLVSGTMTGRKGVTT